MKKKKKKISNIFEGGWVQVDTKHVSLAREFNTADVSSPTINMPYLKTVALLVYHYFPRVILECTSTNIQRFVTVTHIYIYRTL